MDKVINFIYRRFPNAKLWNRENSYFFALILKKVFYGKIYFDRTYRIFCCKIGAKYYYYNGIYPCNEDNLIGWEEMCYDCYDEWQEVLQEYCK